MSQLTSAQSCIDDLDAALKDGGQQITLRHTTPGPAGTLLSYDLSCRALVRGYAPHELVGGITQQDQLFVLSPTEMNAAGWPGQVPASPHDDPRVPTTAATKILTNRGLYSVQSGVGLYVQDVLVRVEIRARGAA